MKNIVLIFVYTSQIYYMHLTTSRKHMFQNSL